jgi:Spy/CpxP family protein refolding chaperone
MKSIRNLLAGSLLAAGAMIGAAATISIASAQDSDAPPPGPHGWHHRGPGRLFSKLNLTDDQKASIKSIMQSSGPQMKSIHEQMRANMAKLDALAPNDPNYATTAAQVAQSNAPLQQQMFTQRAAMKTAIFNVLTPAQQTQLLALEAQMKSRAAAHGWGPRGGGPPPDAT